MADTPPLIFARRLGGLFPVNLAAKEAVAAIEGQCAVKITRATRNQKRRSLYWVLASIVAEALNDMHGLTLTDQDLHDITRDKLGLGYDVELPSGDVLHKRKSTSDRSMPEPERTAYTTKAFNLWSRWIGVPVEVLTREAHAA